MALADPDSVTTAGPSRPARAATALPLVVQVAGSYPPAADGIARQVATMGSRLRGAGFEIGVLTRSAGATPGSETRDGVSIHRVQARPTGRVSSLRFLMAGWRWLSRLDPQPSLVHAHELFTTTLLALRAKRKWGVPVVIELHFGAPRGNSARLLEKPLGRRRLAAALTMADRFVATNRQIRDELLDLGVAAERVVLLPNAVDCAAFSPADADTTRRRRRELRLDGDGPVLVYTGRLDQIKGISVLLDAWPSVRERHHTARLLLVGDGPLRALVEQRAADGVVAVGVVEDVRPYLEAADLFVLPSNAEASSLALLEAMSMALPVVATAVGGTPEVIGDAVNGVLVPPGTSDALAVGLLRALGSPERQRLGMEARRTVLRSHRVEDRVARLAQLYRDLLHQA